MKNNCSEDRTNTIVLFDDWEQNQVVEDRLLIGDSSLYPFKKIIKQVLYPPFMMSVNIEIAKDAIEAYVIMSDSQEGLLELMVYCVESLMYYTLDRCDLEDEFYQHAEILFEEIVTMLTTTHKEYLPQFKVRLEELVMAASESRDLYDNRLEKMWQKI
jgi:hypothetical protein